jgi:hypothetical protein
MTEAFHIAQVNIGRIRAPLTDPIMEGFVSRLDEINALADVAPGFVWRLQTPEGNATSITVFEDERLLLNMSVWETIETLWDFTYKSLHTPIMTQRRAWFEKMDTPIIALWWVPVGHIPTPLEAKAKIEHMEHNGPTPESFTFKQRFPAPIREINN